MFIFRGAIAVQWPHYEADWQNAANIQCGGGYTRDGFSGQHLITATIWCLNTVLWLVRRAILGSDWLICCNDDGHQSMPRVRSVRISKNMIITLSTGLGIHSDREDGKIWNVQTKHNLFILIWMPNKEWNCQFCSINVNEELVSSLEVTHIFYHSLHVTVSRIESESEWKFLDIRCELLTQAPVARIAPVLLTLVMCNVDG